MTDWTLQTDGELLRRMQHGEGEALAEFYRRFAPALRGYFARRAGEPDALDDLVQETMVAAVHAVMRFRGESQVFTWLCGIARHKLLDHYGECKARPGPLDPESAAAAGDSPHDRLCEAEMVQAALAGLPQEYRRAMELRYLDELPVTAVAKAMGKTVKAVESILVRARRIFAREYETMAKEVEAIG